MTYILSELCLILKRLPIMGRRSERRSSSLCGETGGGYMRRPGSGSGKRLRVKSILPKVGKGSKRSAVVESVLWPTSGGSGLDAVLFRWLVKRDLSLADWGMYGKIFQRGVYDGYLIIYRDELIAEIVPVTRYSSAGMSVSMEVRWHA